MSPNSILFLRWVFLFGSVAVLLDCSCIALAQHQTAEDEEYEHGAGSVSKSEENSQPFRPFRNGPNATKCNTKSKNTYRVAKDRVDSVRIFPILIERR